MRERERERAKEERVKMNKLTYCALKRDRERGREFSATISTHFRQLIEYAIKFSIIVYRILDLYDGICIRPWVKQNKME